MFVLEKDNKDNQKDMKQVIVDTLHEVMGENDKIVALDADLGGASGFTSLKKDFPDRFINVGIAEANMVGIAAGLSVTGFVPFIHTFGPFASRRAFDQVFLSGGYAKTTINIFGSDPGFCVGPNGGTHTTLEDVALMRMIPNAVICDPCDAVQFAWLVREYASLEGVHYMRANRKKVRNIYKEGSTFELGKGNVLVKGSDVLLVAAGQLVADALDAAQELEAQGISVEVVDMFCIKPLDESLIMEASKGKKLIVSFENHSVTGGLGSAISEVLTNHAIAIPLKRMGSVERFGEVGTPDYLQKAFGLTSADVVKTIKENI